MTAGEFGKGLNSTETGDLRAVVQEVMGQPGWEASDDRTVMFVLDLLAPLQVLSAQCQTTEGKARPSMSCYVPKQTVKLNCDTPTLVISYTDGGDKKQLLTSLYKNPTMLKDIWKL